MEKRLVLSKELMPLIIETLNHNDAVEITVTGYSMRPFLKHNVSRVVLTKEVDRIGKYDIILYETDSHAMILHRVIKISDPLKVMGDGLRRVEWVKPEQIKAVVKTIHHGHKTIDVRNKVYRFKVFVWVKLRFIRRVLLKIV